MSQENLKIVRRAWDAFGKHGVDAVLGFYAEDCVCEQVPEMPDRVSLKGREGVRQRLARFADFWEDFAIEPVELIDAGEDVVITVARVRGRGKDSGIPIEAPAAFVQELRDGQVIRDRVFLSKAEALEAAGLRE
jgi:ketosteroid isomerase-like protein